MNLSDEAIDAPAGLSSDWLSAIQVSEYAKRYGYAYRMYKYNDTYKGACWHPVRGPILAQWCKILALKLAYDSFPQSDLIVWLDTDVFINHMEIPIDEYIDVAPIVAPQGWTEKTKCQRAEPRMGRKHVDVFLSRNSRADGCCGPNTGIVVLRRSDTSRKLLKEWWDHAMAHGIPGPYDQGFVAAVFYPQHSDEVAVLEEDFLSRKRFLAHACGKCPWVGPRVRLFAEATKRNNMPLDAARASIKLQQLQANIDTQIRDQAIGH